MGEQFQLGGIYEVKFGYHSKMDGIQKYEMAARLTRR